MRVLQNNPDSGTAEQESSGGRLAIRLGYVEPLVDEPVGVVVTNCEPGASVAITASVEAAGAVFEAAASFVAEDAGRVDTAVDPSQGGTYTGVDPFGLWWSGTPVAPSNAAPPTPVTCRLTATMHGQTAASVEQRHWLSAGATVTPIAEAGVHGLFARPGGPGPFPAVVAFGGSGGGVAQADTWAPVLASHGFATLAIAYFAAAGLPQSLIDIEVEVVERAIAWLLARQDIAQQSVAVMGISRGSELALLTGALLDHVGAVVAFAPSGIGWSALGPHGPLNAAAWTFRGQPIPYVWDDRMQAGAPPAGGGPLALCPWHEFAIANLQDRVRAAELPVERIRGPILMVSGEADAMWPSTQMAEMAARRAARHGFAHRIEHLHYPGAGHLSAGVPGMPAPTQVRHPLTRGFYDLGGTPAGNAAARADSWPRVLAFLADALGAPPTAVHA
jgi:dienelactone hydrolase